MTDAERKANYKYVKNNVHSKLLRFYPKDTSTWEKVKDLTSGQIIELITKALNQN